MYIDRTVQEKIALFESNLLKTNRGFNFYVDWNNVSGYDKYEIELHAMDSLIGRKEDFDKIFYELLDKIPTIVNAFPLLFALSKAEREQIACKRHSLEVVGAEPDSPDMQCYSFDVSRGLTDEQKDEYLNFFSQMGLKKLFQNKIEKSTVDYVIGVLVGLDSNGRKNRGGKAFELACEPVISEICQKYGVTVLTQKQFKYLRNFGFEIDENIADRKADFILIKDNRCMNIEVNFFNGSGSKPEEIIDSYINRQSNLKENGLGFALITDGNCWAGTTNQLDKGFRYIDYIMNYRMAKNGMLDEIVENMFR